MIWQHLWRTCATPTDPVCQVLVLPIPRLFLTLNLAVNLEDGFYIGEVVVIMQDLMNTNRAAVVFKQENLDFVEKLAEL
jgi:hypothetical protein